METILENCKEAIFHFNKAHLSNPTIPCWVIKTKGQTFYINHLECKGVSWSTKETPDSSHTKGSIKFKNVNIRIDENGTAVIESIRN